MKISPCGLERGWNMKGTFVDTRYAEGEGSKKVGSYEESLLDFERRGKCPFCPEGLALKALEKKGKWKIFDRSWKGENTRTHFLLVGEDHKTNLTEMSFADWVSIGGLIQWVTKRYKILGGGLAVRFGDTDYSGATICHLHFHLIVPKTDEEGLSRPVNFPIG